MKTEGGLGTTIVAALAKQLDAKVCTASDATGYSVTVGQAIQPVAQRPAG
ncbi:hypothetical protein [Sphingomonas sp. PAMC26645]|nr:hypothetical protein [Sphingomonas sp. PAMC26645]